MPKFCRIDINISSFRFSPTGLNRYNPYYDVYGRPVNYNKQPSSVDTQYENPTSYSSSFGKKRKPKPFSVMLDIYPITDVGEQNKKIARPTQTSAADYELRRPMQYNRVPKFYTPAPPAIGVLPSQGLSEEEERQQMIFHLNLFPRKKNKVNR